MIDNTNKNGIVCLIVACRAFYVNTRWIPILFFLLFIFAIFFFRHRKIFCSEIVIASLRHHIPSVHHHAKTTSQSMIAIEPNKMCENWSNAIEASTSECSWYNHTLQCYGGTSNLHLMSAHRLRRTDYIIFCGWPNITFDPLILKQFPKVRALRIENSNLTNIDKDFPQLMHLQVSQSELRRQWCRWTLNFFFFFNSFSDDTFTAYKYFVDEFRICSTNIV